MIVSPIFRRRDRQGVRYSAPMRESKNDRYDTSLILREGEKKKEIRIQEGD
jgi:hypothetical protein